MAKQSNNNNSSDKSEEDYLRDFLGGKGNSGSGDMNLGGNSMGMNLHAHAQPAHNSSGTIADLQYISFDAQEFPSGIFYRPGTRIMIRPCNVEEIQAFSTVDDDNFYDLIDKMNDMLMGCVKVKYSDGSIGSYLDIKDGDRNYCIFLIRELTFQSGNELSVKANCSCKATTEIRFRTQNMNKVEPDEDLLPYYDRVSSVFKFETINGKTWEIGVPTIGLQKAFTTYITEEYRNTKKLNMSFLKLIPFTISSRTNITSEGIKKHLDMFTNMEEDDFHFINDVVEKMKFGIKDLSSKCSECDSEVHAEMQFPVRPKKLFTYENAFDKFIKK